MTYYENNTQLLLIIYFPYYNTIILKVMKRQHMHRINEKECYVSYLNIYEVKKALYKIITINRYFIALYYTYRRI
jgi:hypothetical protein